MTALRRLCLISGQARPALVLGFAMVWYMWWLAALSFVALIVYAIAHTFNYDRDYFIPTEEVAQIEGERTRLLAEGA